jgi:hypothetical protein
MIPSKLDLEKLAFFLKTVSEKSTFPSLFPLKIFPLKSTSIRNAADVRNQIKALKQGQFLS